MKKVFIALLFLLSAISVFAAKFEKPVTLTSVGQSADVQMVKALLKKAGIEYQNVWLVFDKDEFKDFDEAIEEAEKKEWIFIMHFIMKGRESRQSVILEQWCIS